MQYNNDIELFIAEDTFKIMKTFIKDLARLKIAAEHALHGFFFTSLSFDESWRLKTGKISIF